MFSNSLGLHIVFFIMINDINMNICVMNTIIENITDVKECEINQSINHAYAVIAHSNEQTFSFHLADNKKGKQLESNLEYQNQ